MSEDDLLAAATDALTLYGWRWHHIRRSDKALQQGHPGFPDIVAVRSGHLLAVELKSKRGTATEAQVGWLNAFEDCNALSMVLRPDGLDDFLESIA